MHKEVKNDRLFFDGSFFEASFSACINKVASSKDEIELHCGSTMTRNLLQMRNIRTSHPYKHILLFDDEASYSCRHVKIYPEIAAARAYSIGQTLCIPIVSVLGPNISPHNCELFEQTRCKK